MNLLGIVPYCLILVIRAGNVRLGCWIEGIIYRIDFCLHVVHTGMNCDYVVIGYLHAEQCLLEDVPRLTRLLGIRSLTHRFRKFCTKKLFLYFTSRSLSLDAVTSPPCW